MTIGSAPVFQLIYHSLAAIDLDDDDLNDILKVAQDFNSQHNITGCLFHHNEEFLQILEGEESTIRALYSRIEKDRRNTHPHLLMTANASKRIFGDWAMAFGEFTDQGMLDLERSMNLHNFTSLKQLDLGTRKTLRFFNCVAEGIINIPIRGLDF